MYFHVPSWSFTWSLKIKSVPGKGDSELWKPIIFRFHSFNLEGVFSAIFLRVSPFVTPTPLGLSPRRSRRSRRSGRYLGRLGARGWGGCILAPKHPQASPPGIPKMKGVPSSTVGMFKLRYVSKGMLVNMTYPPWKNQHFESKSG